MTFFFFNYLFGAYILSTCTCLSSSSPIRLKKITLYYLVTSVESVELIKIPSTPTSP